MASVLKTFLTRRMLCVFLLGFSSGVPLLLVGSTLRAWMTDSGVDLTTIGAISLVGLPYSIKFLWAPLMDRYVPPFLDRRRSWIAVCQVGLVIALAAMATLDPAHSLLLVVPLSVVIAFLSASQDIAIDAYRREVLHDEEQGLGASLAVNGYRVGLLIAGAGALAVAQYLGWRAAYLAMAGAVGLSLLATFAAPTTTAALGAPKTLREAVVEPFLQFFSRSAAVEILAFILLFKLGDQMASDMLNPFYLKMGYEKIQIAAISKVFGLWATLAGGLLGGVILLRVPLLTCLWVFGILQMVSTFGFAWIAGLGAPSLSALAVVVSVENLCGGLGMAAYVAFMALLTDRRFTATQYALLASVMSVPRVLFGSTSGALAERLGWGGYFVFCAVIALPGLLMLLRASKWTIASDGTGSSLLQGFQK